jgi:hypothetical protein
MMRLPQVMVGAAVLGAIVTAAASAESAARGPAHAKVCSRFASPAGSDSAPGTKTRPLQSVQELVDRLAPGQTGCLLRGTYGGDVSIRSGGRSGQALTLRGAPGVTAIVRGRFWIADSANWVTVSHLHLDGINATRLPSPTVNGDHATFTFDDVTNEHMGGFHDGDGICFLLGDSTGRYGIAWYTAISHSRIHDCGTSNNHNHGVYVEASYYARIVDNWIYDNADRGIQFYPDAQYTEVRNNIIARNGEGVIFSGDEAQSSSNNQVVANIIVGSRIRYNVEYFWPGPVGSGNVVAGNCIYGGHEGNILEPGVGYAVTGNRIVAPRFLTDSGVPLIARGSACAGLAPPGGRQ